MAKKKGAGAVRMNRDSVSKRLGIKRFGGEKVLPGNIIVRQRGTRFFPGIGTKMGNDFTIYAITSGQVGFLKRAGKTIIKVDG